MKTIAKEKLQAKLDKLSKDGLLHKPLYLVTYEQDAIMEYLFDPEILKEFLENQIEILGQNKTGVS